MILIIEKEGKKLLSSLEVYKAVGYNPANYARWIKAHLIEHAQEGIDYFHILDKQDQDLFFPKIYRTKKLIFRHGCYIEPSYFLTIDMAISVCLIAKTEKARKLKLFLQLHK